MKRQIVATWSFLALLALSPGAMASELMMYVFGDEGPASGITIAVDDRQGVTNASGQVEMTLSQGGHRVTLSDQGDEIHSFRFNSGQGQNVDVAVRLSDDEAPEVSVETYDPRESLSEREGSVKGVVQGEITSRETGAALSGARVSVPGSDYAATTDVNGRFSLELPRGIYDLSIAHPEYGNSTVEDVRVVSNVTRNNQYALSVSGDGGPVEEVTTVASYQPDTVSEQQRTSDSVLDVIGSEQLARFGDSNAADATRRSVGVNVSEGKFVFVRGLGGRYTTTTLNGSSLPSTDPSRRTTPLDLFPAGVLDQVEVRKAFTPDMPGDSSAGNVQLETRSAPEQDFLKLSLGLGANTRITGDSVITDPANGDTDFFGYDDGTRKMPGLVNGLTAFGRINPGEYENAQLTELMGQSFERNLEAQKETINPDFSVGLSGGQEISRGNNLYGIFGALSYDNSWSVKDEGVENTFAAAGSGGELSPRNKFEFFESEHNVDLGGMLALGAELGLNHELESTTLLSRKTETQTRQTSGLAGENEEQLREIEFDYEERQFLSQQFAGEHFLPDYNDLLVEWQYTYSQADRYAPDRRTIRFDTLKSNDGRLVFNDSAFSRRFDDLTDENNDASVDFTLPVYSGDSVMADLKSGLSATRRNRESKTARFSYDWRGDANDELDLIRQQPTPGANDVLSDENIAEDRFVLQNITAPSDRYEADLDINAAYLMTDMDLYDSFRLVTGARVESAEQSVDTFDTDGAPVNTGFDETDVLPSVNLTWFMNPDMQMRFGYSQTISRPDFKEMANASFFDPVFGFTVRGNPDVESSEVDNFDVRWEWYLSNTDTLTVGAFYKDLSQPIERIIIPSGGSALQGTRSFANAEEGEIQGVEVDFRKEFPLDDALSQTLFLQANASLIDSEVTLPERSSENRDTRELQGQADSTMNIALGYDHLDSGQEVTLLFNRNGESIQDASRGDLPSVIEEPVNQLDLTYKKRFSSELSVDAKIENLLDEETEFTQGDNTFFKYSPGLSLSVGADWNF